MPVCLTLTSFFFFFFFCLPEPDVLNRQRKRQQTFKILNLSSSFLIFLDNFNFLKNMFGPKNVPSQYHLYSLLFGTQCLEDCSIVLTLHCLQSLYTLNMRDHTVFKQRNFTFSFSYSPYNILNDSEAIYF